MAETGVVVVDQIHLVMVDGVGGLRREVLRPVDAHLAVDADDDVGLPVASVINNNVNQLMKNLTIVTISISLPTFFASLFGMNVKLPFGMNGDATVGSPAAFWYIIVICVLSVIAFLAVWMRKK